MSMPQIDPSVYDAILNEGSAIGELDPEIDRQKKIAQYLREVLGAVPQSRMSGRIASAPHWMEMVGGLAAQHQAGKHDQDAVQKSQAQQLLRTGQAQRIVEAMKAMQSGQNVPYSDPQGAL